MMQRSKQTEPEFLKSYDPSAFRRPNASVDCVIYTIFDKALHVLLVKRAEHPYLGKWSLVGGYVDIDNDHNLEDTAKRKLLEKTAVRTPYLEQAFTIGGRKRDPRNWSITTVYFALLPFDAISLSAGEGATDIKWSKIGDEKVGEPLAFDHADILKRCTQRLRNKVLYTSLPLYLMPKEFTLSELQKVYEIVLDQIIDSKSFRRRILSAKLLEETNKLNRDTKRPAQIYTRSKSPNPHIFLRNLEGSGHE